MCRTRYSSVNIPLYLYPARSIGAASISRIGAMILPDDYYVKAFPTSTVASYPHQHVCTFVHLYITSSTWTKSSLTQSQRATLTLMVQECDFQLLDESLLVEWRPH